LSWSALVSITRDTGDVHVIAPDLPGFGQSDMPDRSAFTYTFHNIARVPEAKKIDAVLDLVGNSVMLDSLAMLRRGAAPVWPAGWAASIRSPTSTRCCKWRVGVYLTFLGSFVFGTPGFPLSDVPFNKSPRMPQPAGSTSSQPGSPASRRFVRRTA
jgi:hypothetical protein